MDLFRRQLSLKLEMYSYMLWLEWLVDCLCQKKYMIASDILMHSIYKDCAYILFLWNHGKISLKVSSPFCLTVILNISCSIFLRATFPVITQACVWVSVSSLHLFLWYFISFFSHMPILQISNKTCAAHMCHLGGDMYPCSHGGCSCSRKFNYSQWF